MDGVFWTTGLLVWLAISVVSGWLLCVTLKHAVMAFKMATLITTKSATMEPRSVWWWRMFWHGPFTSMEMNAGGKIYWPGREPNGWYPGAGVEDDE